MLEKVYQDHKKWINTSLNFGCTKTEAEDIVGDMYVIIGSMLNKGLDISYGSKVNYFYIYRTLKTNFLKMYNKKKKENKISIDLVLNLSTGEYIDYNKANQVVEAELENLHWYDKKVYNMIQYDYSITELSNKTNISYHSLYNTFRKVKDRLNT